MCRREIPSGYLENPSLLLPLPNSAASKNSNDSSEAESASQYQWFYEGRNGWWEYDERTTAELAEAASTLSANRAKETTNTCELFFIDGFPSGFLYMIDFETIIQYRRKELEMRRTVKRGVT